MVICRCQFAVHRRQVSHSMSGGAQPWLSMLPCEGRAAVRTGADERFATLAQSSQRRFAFAVVVAGIVVDVKQSGQVMTLSEACPAPEPARMSPMWARTNSSAEITGMP